METDEVMKKRLARINQYFRAYDVACKLARKKQVADLLGFADLICPPTKKQRNTRKIRRIIKPFTINGNHI